MDIADHLFAGGAACAAGMVNAIAGGGTLISFPVLVALGLPPVSANVTNTVALSPGYLGGAWAQRAALADQRGRVVRLSGAAAIGGLAGALLLLATSNDTFKLLIPVLLAGAGLLLLTQDRIRGALRIGQRSAEATSDPPWMVVPVAVMSVYGGYFGAGLGIMLLAALGIALAEPLARLNALKSILSFVISVTAALFLMTSGEVDWSLAGVMAVTSLVGGVLGGRLAGKIKPARLRAAVVTIGFAAAIIYAVRYWF